MYFVLLVFPVLQALELPLAPYNVKVFCRQGRRYTRQAQTELQCSSSTTACGFFEFSGPDEHTGLSKIGVYECVDNGILQTSADDDLEEANNVGLELFADLCGAVPQCSSLSFDTLNPSFLKYLIVHHNVRLESLTSRNIRFCCSLFHHTLQKLVTSEKDRLPTIPAPPVHCQSEVCGAEAVGCLMHALTSDSEEDYDESEDLKKTHRKVKRRVVRRQNDNDYDAVELFFDFDEDQDDSNIRFVTKPPTKTTTSRPSFQALVKKPKAKLQLATTVNKTVTRTTTTKSPKFAGDEYEDFSEETEESHCVYRHLNDELYRYCLLVHQKNDGDRCYYDERHTICCCFVPPDKETCDPMEIDIVRPPSPSKIPAIRVTAGPTLAARSIARSYLTTTPATTTTTTSTTTPATTTKVILVKSTTASRTPMTESQIIKRCRITYPRKKVSGSKMRPALVCDSAHSIASCFSMLLSLVLFHLVSKKLF